MISKVVVLAILISSVCAFSASFGLNDKVPRQLSLYAEPATNPIANAGTSKESKEPRLTNVDKWNSEFTVTTNVLLSVVVVLYGVYWLVQPVKYPWHAFRHLAYRLWWCSWLSWAVAWILIEVKAHNGNLISGLQSRFDIPILAFDNLNSIFLLLTCLAIVRGTEYTPHNARKDFFRILFCFAAMVVPLYVSDELVFKDAGLAFELHRTWSLCLAMFAPIAVEWSVHLRFKVQTILLIGLVYGFFQPLVYYTELPILSGSYRELLDAMRPVIVMILASLKIMWAFTCVRVLERAHARSPGSLGRIGIGTSPAQPVSEFKMWTHMGPAAGFYLTILVGIYASRLVMLVWRITEASPIFVGYVSAQATVVMWIECTDRLWKFYERSTQPVAQVPRTG